MSICSVNKNRITNHYFYLFYWSDFITLEARVCQLIPFKLFLILFFTDRIYWFLCITNNSPFRNEVACFTMCYQHVLIGLLSGGDQGLLNSFFSSWAGADITKHLPFVYNLSGSCIYSYVPAFQQWVCLHKLVQYMHFRCLLSINENMLISTHQYKCQYKTLT